MHALVLAVLLAELSPADVARLIQTPDAQQLVLSFAICEEKAGEDEVRGRIKEEQENSKIGGVIDLRALKFLQDKVVRGRRRAKLHRTAIEEMNRKPLSCDHKDVTELGKCASGSQNYPCDRQPMTALVQLFGQFKDAAERTVAP